MAPLGAGASGRSLICFHGQFGLSHPGDFPSFVMSSFSRQQVWSPARLLAYLLLEPGTLLLDEMGRPFSLPFPPNAPANRVPRSPARSAELGRV